MKMMKQFSKNLKKHSNEKEGWNKFKSTLESESE